MDRDRAARWLVGVARPGPESSVPRTRAATVGAHARADAMPPGGHRGCAFLPGAGESVTGFADLHTVAVIEARSCMLTDVRACVAVCPWCTLEVRHNLSTVRSPAPNTLHTFRSLISDDPGILLWGCVATIPWPGVANGGRASIRRMAMINIGHEHALGSHGSHEPILGPHSPEHPNAATTRAQRARAA